MSWGCSLDAVGIHGLGLGVRDVDDAPGHQLLEALIHGLHAVHHPGLDDGVHLGNLVFPDQVTDGGDADHDLVITSYSIHYTKLYEPGWRWPARPAGQPAAG